jgi:serine/threonine-protein kinase
MGTPEEPASPAEPHNDAGSIVFEPTAQFELDDLHDDQSPGAAMVEGSVAGLAGELQTLRSQRLGAAALSLAVVFLVLFVWNLMNQNAGHWLLTVLYFFRFAIAAGCAGVIMSRLSLSPGQLQALEYSFFGTLTLTVVLSQYFGNLSLIDAGDIPGMIAHVKNGVLATVVLMMIYGMFIPNQPRITAYVVLSMAVSVMFGFALLLERSDVEAALEQFRTTEHAGSNALFLLIGAGLSIYGSYMMNGMRSELHAAKSFGQYPLPEQLGAGGM